MVSLESQTGSPVTWQVSWLLKGGNNTCLACLKPDRFPAPGHLVKLPALSRSKWTGIMVGRKEKIIHGVLLASDSHPGPELSAKGITASLTLQAQLSQPRLRVTPYSLGSMSTSPGRSSVLIFWNKVSLGPCSLFQSSSYPLFVPCSFP